MPGSGGFGARAGKVLGLAGPPDVIRAELSGARVCWCGSLCLVQSVQGAADSVRAALADLCVIIHSINFCPRCTVLSAVVAITLSSVFLL